MTIERQLVFVTLCAITLAAVLTWALGMFDATGSETAPPDIERIGYEIPQP